jgi:hypothetical protein
LSAEQEGCAVEAPATTTVTDEPVPAERPAPAEDHPDRGEPGRRRLPERWRVPVPPLLLVAFLGLALWLFAPAWSSPADTTLRGGDGDPAIFIWFLRWTPFALEHGHDLLVTHHLNYPDGVNLMWNTSLVLPGLLLTPLTTRFGPVLSYNLLLVLAYGLSAWCAYLAIRRFVPGHLAAAAGGLVYGFSPAMRGQGSHLHMSLAFLVPLLLLLLHEILVRQRRPPWLAGAALGLLAACQLLTGEELLAMTTLLGFLLFVLLVAGNVRRLRGRVLHTLVAFVTAAVVFAAIAAWPLSVQFSGPQRVDGDIITSTLAVDLYGFVVPSAQQAVSTDATARLPRFAGGNLAYLGVPLLLVLVVIGVRWWRNAVVRVTLALLLAAAVLSLGPSLLVGGRDTGIRLPMALLERLPLLDNMVPNRMALLTALFAGLLLALFLHGVWRQGGWRRAAAAAVGLAVLASLWPARPIPAQKVATPPFFTGASVRELPRDGVTLLLPFPYRGSALPMTWQAESGLWFRMPGGYFIGPRPDGRPRFDTNPSSGSQVLTRIYRGGPPPPLTKQWRRALARDFVRWRIGSVVVGPMPNRTVMVEFLTDLLGAKPERVGGVYLWRNPKVVTTPPADGERRQT